MGYIGTSNDAGKLTCDHDGKVYNEYLGHRFWTGEWRCDVCDETHELLCDDCHRMIVREN